MCKWIWQLGRRSIFGIVLVVVAGCAFRTAEKPQSNQQRLVRQLRAQRREIEILKEKNLVLQAQLAKQRPNRDSAQTQQPLPFTPSAAVAVEPTSPSHSAEAILYGKVEQSYQQKNMAEMKRATELLLKTFPNGLLVDAAIALCVKAFTDREESAQAMPYIQLLLSQYPQCSKVPGVLLAKATILEKANRGQESRKIWQKLITEYAGSRESQVAARELRRQGTQLGKAE